MTDRLDALRGRLERKSRAVPPPRRPRPVETPPPPAAEETGSGLEEGSIAPAAEAPPPPVPLPPTASPPRVAAAAAPAAAVDAAAGTPDLYPDPRPGPWTDEPLANLAVRVRRSLDIRLADVVHHLRREGLRVSKVDVVEMLLWELPPRPDRAFRERVATFRRRSPR